MAATPPSSRASQTGPAVRDPWATAGLAGALAAIVMLLVQLAWRVFFAPTIASFPEIIVAAIARLTPLALFGFLTETFGAWAQNTLFVAVLIGIVAIGYEGGIMAERLYRSGRLGQGRGGRITAGGVVALALFLLVGLVIQPLAAMGLFGMSSRGGNTMLTQLVVTFALFAVVWALLADSLTAPVATASGTAGAAAMADADAVSRRGLLGAGSAVALGGVGYLAWRVMQPQGTPPSIASQEAARLIASRAAATPGAVATPTPVGEPPVIAQATPSPAPDLAQIFEELEAAGELTPRVTAVSDFYHVSKNLLDPTVDGDSWTLTIDGLVDKPLTLTYEDLMARPTVTNITTLCCISNELNGDLVGTAEWTGVPLSDLLTEVGIQADAIDLKLTAADDYQDSFPVALGENPDVLLVVAMNGQPLTADHGYPTRLIVPPIYGMKNVKWLTRIEVVAEDFFGYWQSRGWDDTATYQIWGRIDTPQRNDTLAPGPNIAAGMASAGDRGISKVELSLDEGATWAEATLEPSLNPPFTWVRWVFPFEASGDSVNLTMRAADGDGVVATSTRRSPLPAGATGWPERAAMVGDDRQQ